jgi:hypothetical protein
MYKSPEDEVPLNPVKHGGGRCSINDDCGINGECRKRKCFCVNGNYTGPFCQTAVGFDDVDLDPDEEFYFYGVTLPSSLIISFLALVVGFMVIVLTRYNQRKNDYRLIIEREEIVRRNSRSSLELTSSLSDLDDVTSHYYQQSRTGGAERASSYQNS